MAKKVRVTGVTDKETMDAIVKEATKDQRSISAMQDILFKEALIRRGYFGKPAKLKK